MKKYFIVFNVALATVFFGGCSGEDAFKDEGELITKIGILNEQETTDKVPGTHILETSSSEKTYLRSVSLNLSDNQYLGNRVTVVGVMNDEDNVFEVTGVSVLEVLVKKAEDALLADYKNTDLGFEVKYYTNWEIKEWQNGDVEFKNQNTGQIFKVVQSPYSYVPQVTEEGSSDTPLKAFFISKFPGKEFPGESKIGKEALVALKMENEDYVIYYLYRNGLIYELSMLKVQGVENLIYNEMLGSFRFIGFTAAESKAEPPLEATVAEEDVITVDGTDSEMEFTSFASLPYFFTANYPADWYYSGVNGDSDANVKHHYGFSDETVTADNELIAMDVIVEIPDGGEEVALGDISAVKFFESNTVIFYLEVEGQKYKVSGFKEYEKIIVSMAKSIKPVTQ